MTIYELSHALSLEVLAMPDPDAEVNGGYTGDLLSWVMGRAEAGDVWVTIMTNINIVAVALLAGVSGVIIAEAAEIDDKVVAKAKEQGVNLLRSTANSFETVLSLGRLIEPK